MVELNSSNKKHKANCFPLFLFNFLFPAYTFHLASSFGCDKNVRFPFKLVDMVELNSSNKKHKANCFPLFLFNFLFPAYTFHLASSLVFAGIFLTRYIQEGRRVQWPLQWNSGDIGKLKSEFPRVHTFSCALWPMRLYGGHPGNRAFAPLVAKVRCKN